MILSSGHYGSYLQDEWELVSQLVKTIHQNIKVPITCKIRVFDDVEKTVKYAKMLEASGCQVCCVWVKIKKILTIIVLCLCQK